MKTKARKKNKALSLLVVVLLIIATLLGGLLAYLTDRDSEANVFTLGKVDITLDEDFVQKSMLTPGVKINKTVNVKNSGKSDAWVWVEIAVPAALDIDGVHIEHPTGAIGIGEDQWTWLMNGTDKAVKVQSIEGKDYNVYTMLYNSPLESNAGTTNAAMHQVYLDNRVDIDRNGNWHWVEDGEATAIGWNTEKQGNPVIYVTTYGIQKEGFESVQDGHAGFLTQWNQ